MDKSEVNTVFEILLEKIEIVANQLNESKAETLRTGDYDRARQETQTPP